LVHFASGAIGGIAGRTLTCPIEVLKTRLQSSEHFDGGSMKLLSQIVREEGPGALWKGYLLGLVGVVPKRAFYLYTYSTSKRLLNESKLFTPDTPIVHTLSAGFGGFVTTTMLTPIWMIKTRLQLHHESLSVREAIRRIYNQGGMRSFYKGMPTAYLEIFETIIHFVLYERFRRFVDESGATISDTRFVNYTISGGAAKFCACIMTYPHQVILTRLREENTKAEGFLKTLKQLYREGGLKLLYRGISLELMRSVPNSAIMLGTYEVVLHFLQKHV